MLRLVLAAGVLATIGVVSSDAVHTGGQSPAAERGLESVDAEHLPNVRRWNDRVLTGGTPSGQAFVELAELGVQTVVSVDGATPDTAGARAAGIRYVHLPLGYGAVPAERAAALAKAVRDLPAPLYIHCHHGRHRAPVAAAIGCVAAGLLEPEEVGCRLEASGTDPRYVELCRSAALARPLPAAVIDAYRTPLPETAEVRPLAAAMAEMGVYHSRLEAAAETGWAHVSSDTLAADALLLQELAAELLRSKDPARESEGFSELLRQVERGAGRIQSRLAEGASPEAAFRNVSAACHSCHSQHRQDGP